MRLTEIHCPHCRKRTLKSLIFMGEEVLQCRDCKGLWFDDGELNRAIASHHDHIDEHQLESALGEHLGESPRQCGYCHVPLQHFHLLQEYEVEVDCCASCNGVWLDRHEVEQVLHSPTIQEALTALNQKTSWKSWVFQALTQMPVEYNLPVRKTPWVTWSLIASCILLFVIGQGDPALNDSIMALFGFSSETDNPVLQLVQLFSYQFLHASWLHLLGNMYFLWVIGDNLEEALGHGRYLVVYLLSGAFAGLAEWGYQHAVLDSSLLLIGASGSVAALFGIYLILFRYASLSFMFVVFQKKLSPVWYFVIWSALNVLGLVMGDTGVAYIAHLSGFAVGILVGISMRETILERNPLIRLLNEPIVRISR